MGTRVYQFGLHPPTENAELVREQLRLGAAYRNALVEISLVQRQNTREVYSACGDIHALEERVSALAEQVKALDAKIKARRSATRTRSGSTADRAALTLLRADLKQARVDLSNARHALKSDPAIQAKLEAMNGKKQEPVEGVKPGRNNKQKNEGLAAQMVRKARAACGLEFGTYLLIEAAHGRSCSETPLYDGLEPDDPRFRGFRGEGHVAVHIQGRVMLARDLFGQDRWAKIAQVDERAWLRETPRGERKRLSRTVLSLRVGSNGRTPIMATWPMIMHRQIPPEAVVKWVVVSVQKIGPRERWTCEITVDEPSVAAQPPTDQSPAVAVQICWTKRGDRIRIATWMSTTGESGEITIGDHDRSKLDADGGRGGIVSGFRIAEKIRSGRDKDFNAALEALVSWLRDHDMPEWMRALSVRRGSEMPSQAQALSYLSGWRSQARLASLCLKWQENRFEGDSEAFSALEAWRYHDYHLWRYESEQRAGAEGRRNEFYRLVAVKLTERFGRILMDGTKYNEIKRKPKTEDKGQPKPPKTIQQIVAPGEFREAIHQAAIKRGRTWDKLPADGIAITCPNCGASDPAHKADDGNNASRFGCTACTFTRQMGDVKLLNLLRAGGYGAEVEAIIARGNEVLKGVAA